MSKPRIFKADDGWSVELPTFGFAAAPTLKTGFSSREKVCDWLVARRAVGSSAQLVERATATRSRWADMNIPLVIR